MAFFNEVAQKMSEINDKLSFRITVFAKGAVLVEGHRGVAYLDEEEVRFKVAKDILIISGEGLHIKEINADEALVSGKIKGVEFAG